MKIKILFLLLLMGHFGHAKDSLEISILTCSTGDKVYSLFGHSAIRVINTANETDKVYDFGTFNFGTPNFIYKFLKGNLKYHLSHGSMTSFIREYTEEKRLITEQKLNLSPDQEKQLVERLNDLYKPENRYYYYSFITKNCATDLRDLLIAVGVTFSNENLEVSNRDLINRYLIEKPWLKLGINMIMGYHLDAKTDRSQSMFLPDYLNAEVNSAQVNNTPLVKSELQVNAIEEPLSAPFWMKLISPMVIFSVLLMIYLLGIQKPVHFILLPVLSICGALLVALWMFSGHIEVGNNLNILWCNPLYLLHLLLKPGKRLHKISAIIIAIMLLLSAIVWAFGIQYYDLSIVPLLMLLGYFSFKELKKAAVIKST